MKLWVGITDRDWFDLLASTPDVDEVNFWQPSGGRNFRALAPGELFLFKLHSPDNFIVGGGVFAHFSKLPVTLAWESFAEKNGARSLSQMRARIAKYRRADSSLKEDFEIGCILLEQPFFLPRDSWIPTGPAWHSNIVQGKTFDLEAVEGRSLWNRVQEALRASAVRESPMPAAAAAGERFGEPRLISPRLGQGSFRVLVTDEYERRCAVTGERTLPALEAGHIRPYSEGGEHRIDNGLLLRRDLHALFDRGYMTVTPKLVLEVSRRIREEFENGRDYYALKGRALRPPRNELSAPAAEYLAWHNESVFRG